MRSCSPAPRLPGPCTSSANAQSPRSSSSARRRAERFGVCCRAAWPRGSSAAPHVRRDRPPRVRRGCTRRPHTRRRRLRRLRGIPARTRGRPPARGSGRRPDPDHHRVRAPRLRRDPCWGVCAGRVREPCRRAGTSMPARRCHRQPARRGARRGRLSISSRPVRAATAPWEQCCWAALLAGSPMRPSARSSSFRPPPKHLAHVGRPGQGLQAGSVLQCLGHLAFTELGEANEGDPTVAETTSAWKDASFSSSERARMLVEAMALEQVWKVWPWVTRWVDSPDGETQPARSAEPGRSTCVPT
jgi:hypothetical protein